MSGTGQPQQGGVDATGIRVVVVAGTWHSMISDALLAGAERMLEQANADYRVVRVAGAFELPVVSKAALDTGKPVGFGVLTTDDEQQALVRAGLPESREDKGFEAADAAVRAVLALRAL